jgi:hypothetical protein
MNSRIEHLLIALMVALFAAGVTLIIASAQGGVPPTGQTSSDCLACHTEFQPTWENSAHAKADGISCQSCHGPVLRDHPKSPMPVNRSPDLCVSCHSASSFGLQDWKTSKHSQTGMDCATCHDPHSASLRKIAGPRGQASNIDEVSALCINCHKESNMKFSLTAHAQKGISCADCHVNHIENLGKAIQSGPDHSFKANLDSCNACHSQQMHSPTEAKTPEGVTLPFTETSTAVTQATQGATEPEPVSPMGFSAMAGFIGLAGGMVLAPWLERWYLRTIKQTREDENERENT